MCMYNKVAACNMGVTLRKPPLWAFPFMERVIKFDFICVLAKGRAEASSIPTFVLASTENNDSFEYC